MNIDSKNHTDNEYNNHKKSITQGISKSRSNTWMQLEILKIKEANDNLHTIISRLESEKLDLERELAFVKANAK